MDRRVRISRAVLGWPLTAEAVFSGRDCLVRITGGCAPHIGAVTTAWREAGATAAQTVLAPGHRDDAVSRPFAEALAEALEATVCVSCGIHYDGIDRRGIDTVLREAEALLAELRLALLAAGAE